MQKLGSGRTLGAVTGFVLRGLRKIRKTIPWGRSIIFCFIGSRERTSKTVHGVLFCQAEEPGRRGISMPKHTMKRPYPAGRIVNRKLYKRNGVRALWLLIMPIFKNDGETSTEAAGCHYSGRWIAQHGSTYAGGWMIKSRSCNPIKP